jgi:replicative DNA helicase
MDSYGDYTRIDFDAENEQRLIGWLLLNPDRAGEVVAKITADDFAWPDHVEVFEAIRQTVKAGREPSLNAVLRGLDCDRIIAEGVTFREYLHRITRHIILKIEPVTPMIETLRDTRMRREIETATTGLMMELHGGRDVASAISETMAILDDVLTTTGRKSRSVASGAEALRIALDRIDSDHAENVGTGLADLDEALGGWPRGQLSIVAGRPGMGKSAFAVHAFLMAAKSGAPSLFFSLEMNQLQMGARMLADAAFTMQSPIWYEDIQKGDPRLRAGPVRARLDAAKQATADYPVMIEVQRGLTIAEISTRARRHANTLAAKGQKLETIFVDHIGLVRASGQYVGNRPREIAEITDGLATLAKDLDCAVIGLCQLNRGVEGRENRRPGLSDLKDSGAIEEDASAVIFLYRPAYYLANTREDDREREQQRLKALAAVENVLELIVAKNRNGRTGVVEAFGNIGANAIRDRDYLRGTGG